MATTILTAAASTKDPLSNELKVSMFDSIRMLDADDTQFTTMLQSSQLQKEKANSFKEEWLEDLYLPRLSTLGAGVTAAADTISASRLHRPIRPMTLQPMVAEYTRSPRVGRDRPSM